MKSHSNAASSQRRQVMSSPSTRGRMDSTSSHQHQHRTVLSPLPAQTKNGSSKHKTLKSAASSSVTSVDSMRGLSVISDNPFFSEDSEFDLMHIRITVFGLTGIMVTTKDDASSKNKKDSPREEFSGSTTSEEASPLGDTPIYAVVAHRRNATSSDCSIASYLPSNPLENSMCSFGNSHRYAASWPAHSSSFLVDENDECTPFDQSSLLMERVMMREPYNSLSTFVHETVALEVNLKKGDEIIPVGLASLVVSGDEDGPVSMYLPVQAIRLKGKKVVVADAVGSKKLDRRNRFFSKSATKPFFQSDKSTEFTLDENSALRVTLQVVSQSTLKETEAAKIRRQHSEHRRMEQQKHRETVLRKKYEEQLAEGIEKLNLQSCNQVVDPKDKASSMSQMFCSPGAFCSKDTTSDVRSHQSSKMTNSENSSATSENMNSKAVSDSYSRTDGGLYDDSSSILSSVSESESESEDEYESLKLKSISIRTRTLN